MATRTKKKKTKANPYLIPARKVREIMAAYGGNQQVFAEKCNCSQSIISRWCKDGNKSMSRMSAHILRTVAENVGVKV